jgi:carbon-monoxide dehydrogenase medium subunit
MELLSEEAMTYAAPDSVDAAVALLAADNGAKVLAGGQSLLVFVRQGLISPTTIVGLRRVPELQRLDATDDGGLVIGAMVTQRAIAESAEIGERFAALAEAASKVASPPVRNQGTIGGNLCHADPTGDPPAALIALGAEVEIASQVGRRRIPVEALFADYMETVLEPDELLTAIHLPPPAARSGSAYEKHRIRGVDTAVVGAAVAIGLEVDGETIADARIGLAGASVTPLRAVEAEAALRGAKATDDVLESAAAVAAATCSPLDDTEGSEWYRREMVRVFVRRAAERARAHAMKGA